LTDVLLLHGAWCGAWCWDPVIDELARLGLRAAAPTLAAEDPAAGLEEYVEAGLAAVPETATPLVVGHSLAGVLLEPIARRRPGCALAYVAAFIPCDGMSLRDQWRAWPEMLVEGWSYGLSRDGADATRWTDLDAAAGRLFGACPADCAREAARHLRPQTWAISDARFAGSLAAPSSYISPSDDRLLESGWFRARARELLGVEAIEIDADHSPMLSRPRELARLLADAARAGASKRWS
jgi:pimeloyl-ACP methyl ester carboxylesterase